MKGRGTIALAWSSDRPLFERIENMSISDRDRAEGFQLFERVTAAGSPAAVDTMDSGGTGLTQASYVGV